MPGTTSRRSLLRVTSIAAVAVGGDLLRVPLADAAPVKALGWKRAAFASRVGQRVRLTSAAGSVVARIAAVDDLGAAERPGDPDRFSVIFRGRRPLPGGQGIFRLTTESGHGLDAFVVAVDRGVRAAHYQLIVHRRVHRGPSPNHHTGDLHE